MRLEAFTAVSIMLVLSWVLALYGLTLALKMERACNFATLASTYETTGAKTQENSSIIFRP
jgi:hypothetical protein